MTFYHHELPSGFSHIQASCLKAVICDMDGLLLDTEAVSWQAFCAASKAVSLTPDEVLFAQLTGLSGSAHRPVLVAGLPSGIDSVAFDQDWKQRYHHILAKNVPAKPDAAPFLELVKGAGLSLSIATSSRTTKAEANLSEAGLISYFDHITGGDQVAQSKPAPDIYLRAIDRLGLSPDECLAFEDSNNGVRAAQAAGLPVVQVPDLQMPSEDFLAHSYLCAPNLLAAFDILKLGSGPE
tara:strand:- start:3018 stop:3731 length:714 start_codon:yes stop_codon:yes gene_type:complete